MSEWEFFATRLLGDGTEEHLAADLPFTDPQITSLLSGTGTIQASLSPEIAGLRAGDGRPVFAPWSTALYCQKNGRIEAGGILQGMTSSGSSLSMDVAGFVGYLTDMPYDGATYFVEADTLDVARHIWAHAQGFSRGNIGLQVDGRKSGVPIGTELEEVEFVTGDGDDVAFEAGPLKLTYWLTDDLGKEFNDLAEFTPFDYVERHRWSADGESIEHYLDFGVPTIGRRRQDLQVVVGENMLIVPDVTQDGADYADEVWCLGAGEGRKMRRGIAKRSGETRLRRAAVVPDKQAKSNRAAKSRAEAELRWRKGADDIATVVLKDWTQDLPALGDEIWVQGNGQGWTGDLQIWVRVLGITRSPATDSNLVLSVARSDKVT